MARSRRLCLFLLVMILGGLGSSVPVESQSTTVTITNPTTTCVDSIRKYYQPNGPANSPTFIVILKFLTMSDTCATTTANMANCVAMPSDLAATASGPEISMSPSCQWACNACGTITTNAANDGLPVELMDFGIAELDDEPDSGEEDAREND